MTLPSVQVEKAVKEESDVLLGPREQRIVYTLLSMVQEKLMVDLEPM